MSINWTNVTDMSQLPATANEATGGHFWLGMLYMLWIVTVLLTANLGFETAILTASFIALILGTFMLYIGLVSFQYVLVFLGVILFTFMYIIWGSRK